jgi:hypothetical protein
VRAHAPIPIDIQAHKRVGVYAKDGDDMATDDPIDQDAGDGKSRGGKPRKRTSPVVRRDGKRSLNLRIDYEAHERLAVHALRRGTTISALVEGFAREHLREFHITRTATRTEKPE